MKVSAINGKQPVKTFKGIVPSNAAKAAYSALFTLTLLSAGNNIIQDTFFKSNESNTEQSGTFKPNYNRVIKAQSVYTDMWGNHWVPYSEYRNLEEKTLETETKKEELELSYDQICDMNDKVEDYAYDLEEPYNKLKEEIETEIDNQRSYQYMIDFTGNKIIEKLDRLKENFLMFFFPAFALTLGIGTIRKLSKMDDKNNYLRK